MLGRSHSCWGYLGATADIMFPIGTIFASNLEIGRPSFKDGEAVDVRTS